MGGKLQNKVAVVTGASRGIGRGIAFAFAAEGAKVILASRNLDAVEQVVNEIVATGGTAKAVACEVADQAQVKSLIDEAVISFGGLDILVNNAQGFGSKDKPVGTMTRAPLEDYPLGEWDYTMQTGPQATLIAMQAAFPHLKTRGGSIINLGSRRGQVGGEGTVAYNAAKEAIRAISRTAAREWGKHDITVNVVNPLMESGATEALKETYPEIYEKTLDDVPLRRFGDPFKDAGALAVYLASDGRYITGQTLTIDGGRYIAP